MEQICRCVGGVRVFHLPREWEMVGARSWKGWRWEPILLLTLRSYLFGYQALTLTIILLPKCKRTSVRQSQFPISCQTGVKNTNQSSLLNTASNLNVQIYSYPQDSVETVGRSAYQRLWCTWRIGGEVSSRVCQEGRNEGKWNSRDEFAKSNFIPWNIQSYRNVKLLCIVPFHTS